MTPRKKTVDDLRRTITDEDGRLRYAADPEALSAEEPPDEQAFETVTWPVLTANQVVAYNLQRIRRQRGVSQEWLGKELGRVTGRTWSKASVSAAEASFRRSTRPRRFDANELLAFSVVLAVPIPYFFLPPDDEELSDAEFIADTLVEDVGIPSYARGQLLESATSIASEPYLQRLDAEGRMVAAPDHPVRATVTEHEAAKAMIGLLRRSGISFYPDSEGDTDEQ